MGISYSNSWGKRCSLVWIHWPTISKRNATKWRRAKRKRKQVALIFLSSDVLIVVVVIVSQCFYEYWYDHPPTRWTICGSLSGWIWQISANLYKRYWYIYCYSSIWVLFGYCLLIRIFSYILPISILSIKGGGFSESCVTLNKLAAEGKLNIDRE